MFAQVIPIVAADNHDRVAGVTRAFECVEHAANALVNRGDMPHVCPMAFKLPHFPRRFFVPVENRRSVEIRNWPRFFARVEFAISLRQTLSAARSVRAFEAKPEEERLVVCLLLKEFD